MKAIEQYFPVALFTMLYKAVIMFTSGGNPKERLTIQLKDIEQLNMFL